MAKKASGNGKVRKSKARADQNYLPGTEPVRFKEIDSLALEYRDVRDERQQLTEDEVKLKEKLLAMMHEHSLLAYTIPDTDPPLEVVVELIEETVKVRKKKIVKPKKQKVPAGPDSGDADEGFEQEE